MSKRSKQDRISTLPDGALLHILSFLGMKEMVRTSILSKQWRNTWTYTPTLTFEYNDDSVLNNFKFVGWANKSLKQLPSCTSIDKFKVEFNYSCPLASDVDAWLCFASERKVQDVIFSFPRPSSKCCLYSVPECLLGNSSIINLSLRGCKVMPSGDISWTSLRALSLEVSLLDDHTIAKILSGSPMLEDLKLSATKGLCHLRIGSQSLRRLEIQLNPGEANESLEISTPRLQGLCLSGSLHTQSLLVHAPSLVRAEIKFSHPAYKDSVIAQLLRSLFQVKELELNRWSFQALIISMSATGLLLPLSSLTCLKLNANIDKGDVPSIIILLVCSPNLGKFVLTETQNGSEPSSTSTPSELYWRASCYQFLLNYWRTSSKRRNEKVCLLPHLNTVKFTGFEKLQEVVKSTRKMVEFGENYLSPYYASIDHHQ